MGEPDIRGMTKDELTTLQENLAEAKENLENAGYAVDAVYESNDLPDSVCSEAGHASGYISDAVQAIDDLYDDVQEAIERLNEFEENYGQPTLSMLEELGV